MTGSISPPKPAPPAPPPSRGEESAAADAGAGRGRRVPRAVPGAIALAWLAALAVQASGNAAWLDHDAPFELGLPLPAAYGLFALSWTLMLVAMMLPTMIPLLRLFRTVSAGQARHDRAFAAFLAGYTLIWVAFGFLALTGDVLLHVAVDAVDWLDARPGLIGAAVLALAGAFQFSDLKERCLTECRNPGAYLLPRYRHGTRAAFALAREHARFCLGCCWALMLVMFAVGVADLIWMAPLAALMIYEKVGRHGPLVARLAGVALLAWAALALAVPAWLPSTLATS